MSKRIAVVGMGYVGLVQAVGLSDFGNTVVGVDVDGSKIRKLISGVSPIYEHDVEEYLKRNLQTGRLTFTDDISAAIKSSEVVFLSLGTPSKGDGGVDLSQIEDVVKVIAKNLDGYKMIVTKSTVPVGTNKWIADSIREQAGHGDFDVVSNPEFVREGRAIQDFFHPDRVVVGTDSPRAREIIQDIYRPLYLIQTPMIWCNWETAELTKYACNGFLATKIAYINQMANLADAVGGDIHVIAKAMGMDGRINPKYLHPGPGFGGSCFPKDLRALVNMGNSHGAKQSIAKEVIEANKEQGSKIVEKLQAVMNGLANKTVGVLGGAFKSETDDVRESPALAIIEKLLSEGARVNAHDPKAIGNMKAIFGERIRYFSDVFDALKGSEACMILTEWNEYRNLDLDRAKRVMSGSILMDARNIMDPENAKRSGFTYRGVGRR